MLIDKGCISWEYINIYSIHNTKIGIPIFQRFYDWNSKQMNETLNDILNSLKNHNKEIYLLDFIYYEEDEKIKLADGQQRIVSLNILIKAINDYIVEHDLLIDQMDLFDISYDNFEYDKKYQNAFNNYMIPPFKKLYIYLYNFIDNNKDQIKDIIEIIKNNIFVYMKKTKTSDDAFNIFTQINTGGKPLSKDEVIKTTIDQYSKIYKIKITENVKELKKTITGYYKYIYSSSGKDFDSIAVLTFIKEHVVKDKKSFENFENYLHVVSKLSEYSISYIIRYINRPQLFDIVNIMAMKGIDIRKNKDYITYVMFPICLLSVAMTMKKSNPGGIIKSLYANVIDSIKNDKKPIDISALIATFINDNAEICKISFNDFEDALGKKDLGTKVKEALLIMDVISHSTSSDIFVPNINLEHIYPQKPDAKWAINGWPTSDEESQIYIHNIGNYLLLNEQVNKSIKNKYIIDKVDNYKKIIPNDIALQTALNTVDFNQFETNKMNYIRERQHQIAEYIYENFMLGKVIIFK